MTLAEMRELVRSGSLTTEQAVERAESERDASWRRASNPKAKPAYQDSQNKRAAKWEQLIAELQGGSVAMTQHEHDMELHKEYERYEVERKKLRDPEFHKWLLANGHQDVYSRHHKQAELTPEQQEDLAIRHAFYDSEEE